jgi:hypothetical protein
VDWGFHLVPPTAHPEDWLGLQDTPSAQPTDADAAAEHAELIRARWPSFQAGSTRRGAWWLRGPDANGLPLYVQLEGHSAWIQVAEWDTIGRREEIADVLVDLATALTEHTGWMIFADHRVVDADGLRRLFLQRREVELGFFRSEVDEVPRRRKFLGLF